MFSKTKITRKQKWEDKQQNKYFKTTNKQNPTREKLDVAKEGKPCERMSLF